ncbi:hypothetical protein CHS0354_021947 [Potamilus streckersoni]|uniref:Ankyrin repeat protein n=1 Tax=Potamilus streckersoni TaxID=2493646 RepID=A0AAE0SK17_9BIVA|nr:hypothetical protein CHS0354_021947 [Potamilus streckersoni]
MKNLPYSCRYQPSYRLVKKAIQHLKINSNWDPKCVDAYKALENACYACASDVFDLLLEQGVSLTMKNLPNLCRYKSSYWFVKKAIQHLKINGNWDPKCVDAYRALENADSIYACNVFDLLLEQGVSLTMKNLHDLLCGNQPSYMFVKKVIQTLKDTSRWDPKCEYATKALENAKSQHRIDIYWMLCEEGVTLKM